MDIDKVINYAECFRGEMKWGYVSGVEKGAELILSELLAKKKITAKLADELSKEIARIRHGL